MGNTHGIKKAPSVKRRATIGITKTMNSDDYSNEEEQQINNTSTVKSPSKHNKKKKRGSWSTSNLKVNHKEINQINLLSPMHNKGFNPETSKHDHKNRGKISISTYHSVNNADSNNSGKGVFRTPPSNKRTHGKKLDHPFLSPNQPNGYGKTRPSMMSSASSINAKLFSPSANVKSRMSMSTASPKHGQYQFIQHGDNTINNVQITSQCTNNVAPTTPTHTHRRHGGDHAQGPPQNKLDKQTRRRSLDINEIVVASRFRLMKKLGKGSFGVAYQSLDILTNKTIAIKLERKREDHRQRSVSVNTREIIILEKLENCHRVPKLIWHGQYKQYRVMALELQGMNLCDLYEGCARIFSLKTVIYILIECILCMQDIHSKGIVHRDIKPQNFIISRNPNSNKIYVIDFGLSSWYINSIGEHISYNDECSPVGTARYASLNNHRGIHQTRRDDLESIGYMIVFFLKKELPWQGLREPGRVKKWKKIQQKKASTTNHSLTAGLPMEFCYYLDNVKKLKYNEKPEYSKLCRVFKKLYVAQGFYAQDLQRLNNQNGNDDESNGSSSNEYNGDYDFNIADIIVPDWKETQ